jgi:hypothetical protein
VDLYWLDNGAKVPYQFTQKGKRIIRPKHIMWWIPKKTLDQHNLVPGVTTGCVAHVLYKF